MSNRPSLADVGFRGGPNKSSTSGDGSLTGRLLVSTSVGGLTEGLLVSTSGLTEGLLVSTSIGGLTEGLLVSTSVGGLTEGLLVFTSIADGLTDGGGDPKRS